MYEACNKYFQAEYIELFNHSSDFTPLDSDSLIDWSNNAALQKEEL